MRFSISKESGQISRFSIVGGVSVVTYYALLYGFTEFFGLWYIASALVAFGGYFATNFSLQKYWAFKNRSKKYINRQLFQFTMMAIGNWVLNTSLLYVFVEYGGLHYMLAQAILTILVSIIAYFCLRYIFRHR